MVFADSSALIAAYCPREREHKTAIAAWRAIAARRQKLLLTDLVLAETVTLLRRWAGYEVSRRAGDALLRSHNIEVAALDRDARQAAWREFTRNADPKLSLCDAASFVVMRERGISVAFTFDQHFREAGFEVVP